MLFNYRNNLALLNLKQCKIFTLLNFLQEPSLTGQVRFQIILYCFTHAIMEFWRNGMRKKKMSFDPIPCHCNCKAKRSEV